jgi:hypothetical protein
MARPAKNDIDSGIQNWHQKIDDNDEALFNGPLPIHEHTGDESDLQSTFPAASFDRCLVMVDHSTLGWSIYGSNGTSWQRVALLDAEAVTALTDSTGGSANDTLVAISGSGDDTNINNNFADLVAKVNAIRTALVNHGLLS